MIITGKACNPLGCTWFPEITRKEKHMLRKIEMFLNVMFGCLVKNFKENEI